MTLYQKINSSQMAYVMRQVRLLITALPSGIKIFKSMKYFLNLCLRVEGTEAKGSLLSSLLSNAVEVAEHKASILLYHFAFLLHVLPYQCLCFLPLNKNRSGILYEIPFPNCAQQNSAGFDSDGILPFAFTKVMSAC